MPPARFELTASGLGILRSIHLSYGGARNISWLQLYFFPPESNCAKTRVCPLGQKGLEALLEYQHHYENHWERKPEGPRAVFLSMWDMRINTRTIPRTIRKWCKLAGVKRVNPHAFRHSAATHMLENGADIRVIQKLLGHASIITTEIYTQVAIRKVKTVHANTHPRA